MTIVCLLCLLDNFGEVLSPLVVLLAVLVESIFYASGLQPAPFLAKTGTLVAWRNRGGHNSSVESPLVLLIVFGLRIGFCWAEINVRQKIKLRGSSLRLGSTYLLERNRRIKSLYFSRASTKSHKGPEGKSSERSLESRASNIELSDGPTTKPRNSPSPEEEAGITTPSRGVVTGAAAQQTLRRQTSVLKLYNRIARSDVDVRHLRYAAACLVILQPFLLVVMAASFGETLSS